METISISKVDLIDKILSVVGEKEFEDFLKLRNIPSVGYLRDNVSIYGDLFFTDLEAFASRYGYQDSTELT